MTIKAQIPAGAQRVRSRPLSQASSQTPEPRDGMAWTDLAACAAALLLIDDARVYGLIDGDLDIDRVRCREILAELKGLGIEPSSEEAEVKAIMAELGALRG